MNENVYRNHPTVMVQNIFTLAVILIFIALPYIMDPNAPKIILYAILAIVIVWILIVFISWKRTTITFEAEQAVVESNVFYKKRKVIPYSKIASANVVRNVFNRIFGTTRLQININSSHNAAMPEASFVFKKELADQLRAELMSGIFKQEYKTEEEEMHESALKFNESDAILYGMIGKSSWSFMNAIFWGAFSLISAIYTSGGGLVISLLMLGISSIIPIISQILRYFNFKVYRVDDKIHIQHGMIETYRTSFEVKRINAVRVKRPYFARLLHKCCIEAEVVGINAVGKETTPLLSLLIREDQLDEAMKALVPEFIREMPTHKQPADAKFPLASRSTYAVIAWLAIMAYPCWWLYYYDEPLTQMSQSTVDIISILMIAGTLTIAVLAYVSAYISYKKREFGMDEDMFILVNGVLDRETVIMQYDRVQITEVYNTPMARRFGLAKIEVSLLSSSGAKNIRSGYFEEAELSKISDKVMERLSDGRYDYRMTEM